MGGRGWLVVGWVEEGMGLVAYCHDGVVFHEAWLGAGEDAQEGEDERCCAQQDGDDGGEAHGGCDV